MRRILLMLLMLAAFGMPARNVHAQIQLGDAVTTRQGVAASDIVFRYYHVQTANTQTVNTNWAAPTFAHPTWNQARLGSIFGLALDNNGNSYVTATSCYGGAVSGTGGGPGTIYRIDGVSNAVTNWATLPNTGPALGNICFDPDHNGGQFFVTNHEDGKIYRLSMAGVILSTYDPFTADNGAAGFAPRGERLWGIGYNGNAVYFSVWREDCGFPNPNVANQIYSIGLNGSGDFTGTPALRVTLPTMGSQVHSAPVSDIEFTQNANPVRMLIGERTMISDMTTSAHASRVLEYIWNGTLWTASPATFSIGVLLNSSCGSNGAGSNSLGGVDYGYHSYNASANATVACDSAVWTMGDALHFTTNDLIYGLQRLPRTGGSIANSVLIDHDGSLTTQDKTRLGDVDIFRRCAAVNPNPCTSKSYKLNFAGQQGYCCCWDLSITNSMANYWTGIRIDVLTPGVTITSAGGPGTWTTNFGPLSTLWTPNAGTIPTGTSGNFRFCINPGSNSLQVVQLTWIGPQGVVCRDTMYMDCSPNPTKQDCPCGKLLVSKLECKPTAAGLMNFAMTFAIQNNSTFQVSNAAFTVTSPVGASMTPNSFSFTTINPGFTSTSLTSLIQGATPGSTICFTITLSNAQKTMYCSFDTCIVLPVCKQECCDPKKFTMTPPTITYNTLGQVTITTKVGTPPLRRFSATLVSATRAVGCPTFGAASPVLATVNNGWFATTPPMTPPTFGTADATWKSLVGSTPISIPTNLSLGLLFPAPPGGFLCRDRLRFCIRYTYTDTNCLTCDTTICYELIRKKPWWHTPVPSDGIPFKVEDGNDGDGGREKQDDRSLLSSTTGNPVRIVMDDASNGTLIMTSPAMEPGDDPADAITIVSMALEPAVGTDLTAMRDLRSRADAAISGRVGSLTLNPAFPQGTERRFTVSYNNYVGALSFANYIKVAYYRGTNSADIVEDAFIVYARVPNPAGAQDELTLNGAIQLQNVRSYALRFKNNNAPKDYIYRVEVGLEDDANNDIIATGPGLDRSKVGLQAYRTKADQPHLQMESPGEEEATPGAVLPDEEVTPIFVTVTGTSPSLVFTYTTYNEVGDVVSEGTLIADSPLMPGTSDVSAGTALWNEVGFVECFPNPMTHGTTFRFQLPRSESAVWLSVTDMQGAEVARILDGTAIPAGEHTLEFDGSKLPSGNYFYTLRTGSFTQTRRMQILR